MTKKLNITFIGSGNVASHLSKALFQNGIAIPQIFSRELKHAQTLAKEINAEAVNDLKKVNTSSDLYIIAIKDDLIETVAAQLPQHISVVHTSGGIGMNVLANNSFDAIGVLYPLQSFSKGKTINFNQVPFFIESNKADLTQLLKNTIEKISPYLYEASSEQREQLHIAGVFVNNFTNLMYMEAARLMQKADLPFEALMPLITETINKLKQMNPQEAQTGPARRSDGKTIQNHINKLSDKELKEIYRLLTNRIQMYFPKQ